MEGEMRIKIKMKRGCGLQAEQGHDVPAVKLWTKLRSGGEGDAEFLANASGGEFLNFAVSRYGLDLLVGGVPPDRVTSAFPD